MTDEHGFPQTRHSMINRIQVDDDETRRNALSEFAESYRQPLLQFLTNCLVIEEVDAEDLVQRFFVDKIMSGKVLALANGEGRFRNALRSCLKNFFIDSNRTRRRERIDRYFDVDLDEDATNDLDALDIAWATALFRTALLRLKGESQHWDLFFDRVLTQPPLPYDAIIAKHGYSDPEQASDRLITAKRQFNRILNECVQGQSHLSGVHSDSEYKAEIGLVRQLLKDAKIVDGIVHALDKSTAPTEHRSMHQHSIQGEHVLFVDESADSSWDKTDMEAMFLHLVEQPTVNFMADDSTAPSRSLRDVLFNDSVDANSLSEVLALKRWFNARGEKRNSKLPERIDILMTFAMIAKFIILGGEVEDITSMRRDVLTNRLSKLIEKDWVANELRDLLRTAVARLLG